MRHKRSLPATAAAAVLLLTLSACSGGSDTGQPANSSASPSPAVSPAETTAPSPTADTSSEVLKGTGVYNGQIDNHSIEIETADGADSFELGLGTEDIPETLTEGQKVTFEYTERSVDGDGSLKQRILSKLAPADSK